MNLKLVSVIMSVHNDEKTVEKSIESIVKQDYKNLELLLIDDGSSDKTYEICKKYSNSFENIRLYQNDHNIGLTKSLNILLKKAEGYFIARQDADDISASSRLEEQLKFMEKYNLDACTTRAFVMNSNKITPSKSYYLPKEFVMRIKNPFIHGTLIAKKEAFYKVGLYNEKFYYSQDYKLQPFGSWEVFVQSLGISQASRFSMLFLIILQSEAFQTNSDETSSSCSKT